jgi:hypothetical protein
MVAHGTSAQDISHLKPAPFKAPVRVRGVASAGVREASGMACSHRNPGCVWLLNDSGNGPFLFCFGKDGKSLGKARVAKALNLDWEDMASFVMDGKPYLLVADVGDNPGRRPGCLLYVIEEPKVGAAGIPDGTQLEASWHVLFSYEDGPRDCESVAVDVPGRQILLLSKRDAVPVLYTLPLAATPVDKPAVAKRVAALNVFPRPTAEQLKLRRARGRYGSQPTGMDIAADGRSAVVLTYTYVYRFTRAADELWAKALQRPPQFLRLPDNVRQGEAVCISADGKSIHVASEGNPGPLIRFDARPVEE